MIMADGTTLETNSLTFQLYEIDGDPNRKEFLDDLFIFMQKRGELCKMVMRLRNMAAATTIWANPSKRTFFKPHIRLHVLVLIQARPHNPTPTFPTTSLPPHTQSKLNSSLDLRGRLGG
jgi:hypothetical protein